MKISKIYSNSPEIFSEIQFIENGINLIFAEIKESNNENTDTHNLGKSTLAELIDFMMLKKRSPDSFLFKHQSLFEGITFFLEIHLDDEKYLTIKRSIINNSKISFNKTKESTNLTLLVDSSWDHNNVAIDKAKELLDTFLDLKVIQPWNYRDALSYFLRTQNDYQDVFQLSKFMGKHKDWKPYLFHILGFNGQLIENKYNIEEKLEQKKQQYQMLLNEYPGAIDSLDKIKGIKTVLEQRVHEQETQLDNFDFLFKEKEIQKDLVETIESRIVELNKEIYALNFEIDKIKNQLSDKINFDLEKIEKIYKESLVYFGDQIKSDYKNLIEFNKQISSERNKYITKQLKKFSDRKLVVEKELEELNDKRKQYINFLKEKDIFVKYKSAQNDIVNFKAKIELINHKIELSKKISEVSQEISNLETEKTNICKDINILINSENKTYEAIRIKFSEIVKFIINEDAIISITINKENNIEFNAEILDASGTNTSQNKGTSYRRILCAAFDIALLIVYSTKSFFHFVYHDGLLEGLDNRKKIQLITFLRVNCTKYKIQHIMTAIDSDWPRDENGSKKLFIEKEIIKKLHDKGKDGRLFRLEKF